MGQGCIPNSWQSEATWPEEELEWMATTSFNHAIDCYSAHEIERAKEWATKAINLAHYCHDGRLEEILQSKYLRLSFDGGSGQSLLLGGNREA
jgi:hypothetical protein